MLYPKTRLFGVVSLRAEACWSTFSASSKRSRKIGVFQTVVPEDCARTGNDVLFGVLDHCFPPAGSLGGKPCHQVVGVRVRTSARIGLNPQFKGLECFFQIPGYFPIIVKVNKEFLPIARVIAQLPGFRRALTREGPVCRRCVVEP
jgi:hypothetical protein